MTGWQLPQTNLEEIHGITQISWFVILLDTATPREVICIYDNDFVAINSTCKWSNKFGCRR